MNFSPKAAPPSADRARTLGRNAPLAHAAAILIVTPALRFVRAHRLRRRFALLPMRVLPHDMALFLCRMFPAGWRRHQRCSLNRRRALHVFTRTLHRLRLHKRRSRVDCGLGVAPGLLSLRIMTLRLMTLQFVALLISPVLLPCLLRLLLRERLARLRRSRRGRSPPVIAVALRILSMRRLRTGGRRHDLHRRRNAGSRPILEMPAYGRFTRLVVVIPLAQFVLMLRSRITVAGIMPLINWRRGRPRNGAVVPMIPAVAMLHPARTPMDIPSRRRVDDPTMEIHRRIDVITHGHTQHKQWHLIRINGIPGTVVPDTRIPAVIVVHPVQTVVKEIVGLCVRRVIDGRAGYQHELRIKRLMDADADPGY